MEPQFAELAVQLPRVGLAQQRSFISQKVDVERRPCELISRQLLKPVSYFRFQLNRTPSHSVDAIAVAPDNPPLHPASHGINGWLTGHLLFTAAALATSDRRCDRGGVVTLRRASEAALLRTSCPSALAPPATA